MWEPALIAAIKKDVNAILGAFHGQANLSFSSFKVLLGSAADKLPAFRGPCEHG